MYPMIVEYKKQMTETNEQIRPNKHTDTNRVVINRGERIGGGGEKEINYMVTEENSVYAGEHTAGTQK